MRKEGIGEEGVEEGWRRRGWGRRGYGDKHYQKTFIFFFFAIINDVYFSTCLRSFVKDELSLLFCVIISSY